jgi:hypothetical protein
MAIKLKKAVRTEPDSLPIIVDGENIKPYQEAKREKYNDPVPLQEVNHR